SEAPHKNNLKPGGICSSDHITCKQTAVFQGGAVCNRPRFSIQTVRFGNSPSLGCRNLPLSIQITLTGQFGSAFKSMRPERRVPMRLSKITTIPLSLFVRLPDEAPISTIPG